MKKLLATLVILLVAAGMFAQEIVPFGAVGLTFGGQIAPEGGAGADPEKTVPSWLFSMSKGAVGIGVRYISEKVFAQVSIDNTGDAYLSSGIGWSAFATYTFESGLGLTVGHRGLPSGYFSDVGFNDDGCYFNGATVIDDATQIAVSFMGFQLGVAGEITSFATTTPVIFAAYNFGNPGGPMGPPDPVTFGVTFAGWATDPGSENHAKSVVSGAPSGFGDPENPAHPEPGPYWDPAATFDEDSDSAFPMLFTVHGRYAAEAFSVYGNVGLWIAPETLGKCGLDAQAMSPVGQVAGKDSMVLEGYVGFTYHINEALGASVTVSYAQQLADEEKGGGASKIHVALGVPIGLGGGFSIIPGFQLDKNLKKNVEGKIDDDKTAATVKYGVTATYRF